MKLFDNYNPIPAADPYHADQSRFKALACGVRSSKTFSTSREFIKRIYEDVLIKEKPVPVDDTHRRYWCVAPTYKLSRKQERAIRSMFTGDNAQWLDGESRAERIIYFKPNIAVEFLSAERPLNLVAEGIFGLWLDEAARIKADAWSGQLSGRLSSYEAWTLFSTSPLGRNWFYKEVIELAMKGTPGYSWYTWPTVANVSTPGIDVEVEFKRRTMPEAYFKREYEASFDAFMGQIYEEWDEDVHVWFLDKHGPIPDYSDVHYAFDPGFRHYGCLSAFLHLNDGLMLRTGEVAERGKVPGWWVQKAAELQEKFGEGEIRYDPSRPEYGQLFHDAGMFATKAKNAVNPGIEEVAKAIHPLDGVPGFMVTEDCKLAREQMPSYRWADNENVEKPLKADDDACDEIRYGLYSPQSGVAAYD